MEDFVAENQIADRQWCRICGCLCSVCRFRLPFLPCTCRSRRLGQKWIALGLNRHEIDNCEVCAALNLNRPPQILNVQIVRHHQIWCARAPVPSKANMLWKLLLGATPRIFSWVFLRALRISVWVLVFLLNAFCFSLHPWGLETAIDFQGGLQVSGIVGSLLSTLFYNALVAHFLTIITLLRLIVGDIFCFHPEIGNHLHYAHLLWTPLRILSDWWHDLLLTLGFFHRILDGPRDVVVCPRKPNLNNLGAVRTLLAFLDDSIFAVLGISVYMSSLFSIMPYLIGICVLNLPKIDTIYYLSNGSPIFVGYLVMVSISASYFVMRQVSFGRLPEIIVYIGLAPVFLLNRFLVRLFSRPRDMVNPAIEFISWIRDGVVSNYKLALCPLLLGVYLQFSTIPVIGTRSSYSRNPLCIVIQWCCGFSWLLISSASMRLRYKIVGGQGAFCCLENVSDIQKMHFAQYLSALAFQGAVILTVVHLPINTISLISSSFFPLQFWAYDTRILFSSMAAYGFLVRVGVLEWLAELIGGAIEPIVRNWITTVTSWLQRKQIERFVLRVGVMLVLAALSMYLVSIASMALPILVGRAFFQLISFAMQKFGLKQDDLYGFWIGCFILRNIYTGTCFMYSHIRRNSAIPALLVLLVDLMVIIPSLVPQDETPGFFSVQERLVGLVVLHIWTYLTVFTRINRFQNTAWRERIQVIRRAVTYQLPSKCLLLLGLILETTLTTICFPDLVAGLGFSGAFTLSVLSLGFAAKLSLEIIVLEHM